MAIQVVGFGGAILEVETTLKAARTTIYPREVFGLHSIRATTGVMTAALAVDAPVFGIRAAAAPTKDTYITRICGSFSWVVAATAAQQFGFYWERFSAANLAGGVAALVMKHDTNHPTIQAQDVRVSAAAALTVAGVTFDGNKVPFMSWTNSAIGTGVLDMPVLFDGDVEGPIRLRAGEGISFRNLIVWPAAGTGVAAFRITVEER